MSLKVWLPLNGNLNNLGTSNIEITNNGATVNNSGKIGKCYQFNNTNITASTTATFNSYFTNEISVALWVKISSSHASWAQALTYGTVGTSWNDIKVGIDINSAGTPYFTVSNGSSATSYALYVPAINDDKWHHLVGTYKSGVMTIYLDGLKSNTTTTTIVPAWTACTVLSIGGNSSEKFKTNDCINDVRIYNHCLSDKEIKELSKGLVLHYKLDNPNEETTTNLLAYSNLQGHGSQWILQNETYLGDKVYKNIVNRPNQGNNAGFSIKDYLTSPELSTATNITLSFYKRLNIVYGLNIGGYITFILQDGSTILRWWSYNKPNWANDETSIGKWEFITSTVNVPLGTVAIKYCYVYIDRATGGDCDFSNIQLELKNHASAYVPGYENLFVGRTYFNNTNYWSKSKYNNPASSVDNTPYIDSDGNIVLVAGGSTSEGYTYTQSYTVSSQGGYISIKPNSTYTLSLNIKQSSTTARFIFYIYQRNVLGSVNLYYKDFYATTDEIDKWIRREFTITTQPTTDRFYVELNCYTSPIGGTVTLQSGSISCVEEGSGTRVGKITDSSGYGYDGTINGTLTLDNTTPRYQKCTKFDGQSYIRNTLNINEIRSVSFWLFYSNEVATNSTNILFTNNASSLAFGFSDNLNKDICVNVGQPKLSTYSKNGLTLNNWNHIAIVQNDSINKLYINGIIQNCLSSDAWYTAQTNDFCIGRRDSDTPYPFTGNISDFRLYSTILTQEDILQLYHTSAFADNLGNLECYEINENINTKPKIHKSGVVSTDLFYEIQDALYLPAGTYVNTGLHYDGGDTCRAETLIQYASGGSGRDLMGYSGAGNGYWGVTSAGTWEPHGQIFENTDADITKLNHIVYQFSSSTENGDYLIGRLGTSYTTRNKYIYHVRLFKNGVLERDLYPTKRGSSIGLVDALTDTFYAASGSPSIISNAIQSKTKLFKDRIQGNEFIEI